MRAGARGISVTAMEWRWRYEDERGQPVQPIGDGGAFPTQADAESWIGETWSALLSEGVEQVTLLEGERVVYGPMGLRPSI